MKQHRLRRLAVAVGVISIVTLLTAAACGGGDDDEQTPETGGPTSTSQATAEATQSGDEQAYSGVVVTTEQVVGENRFSVGVIDDAEGQPIQGAEVSLNFFKVTEDGQGELRSEADTEEVVMDRFYIDEETGETVGSGQIAVYVAHPEFDEEGNWGVQVTGTTAEGDTIGPINLAFEVLSPDSVLNAGDPAPKSRQTLASDVDDISEIDTMQPPDPMHDMTIEDAVTSGRSTVIIFGTPAFCETLTCGPVMQTVMLPLYDQYQGQANFIHVEPYFVEEARTGMGFCAVPAFNVNLARAGVPEGPGTCPSLTEEELTSVGESWNLTTEPIIFVVDADGNIAGKFEAVVGPEEVESLLTELT